jgi:large exoprotein involved in heme utilization and adhesion
MVSNASSTGPAGQVLVSAPTVTLTDGAEISSSAQGAGHGGSVAVTATEAITISRRSSDGFLGGVFSNARGSGDAGQVLVSAPSLVMADSAIQSNTITGPGNAGVVMVDVGTLSLAGGAQIASSTFGAGQGGNVTITAGNSIAISGRSSDGFPSGVFASTTDNGNAGQISVSAPVINVSAGAKISSSATTHPVTHLGGTGRGGTVTVTAGGSLTISDPGSGLFTQGNIGSGGNLLVTAGRVTLNNGATISAKSTGTGNAGDILIRASDSFLLSNSSVTTNAPLASGGNISIDSKFILVDPSQIIASAGINGGNISLTATNGIFISFDSIIDASGALGVSGSINISAPTTNLSGTLAPLSQDFMQAATLLRARCAARLSGKSSSFVVAGRDGLPPTPGGLQSSPLTLVASQPRLALDDGNTTSLRTAGNLIPHAQTQTMQGCGS